MENRKSHIACLSKKRPEIDEEAHLKEYIMWENKSNICWLDASMALIAHNKVMKRAAQISPQSKICIIILGYSHAIALINKKDTSSPKSEFLLSGKRILNCIQEKTLQYLSPMLKFKLGNPDSAFCSLYNLLKSDPIIKGLCDATWISDKTCTSCAHSSKNTNTKPLITLSKVDYFDPKSPSVIYNCCCGKSEQIMKFIFVTLPPCLIFHFENGAGHEKPPLSFVTQNRDYYLTGMMTLEKGQESNVNHFISWVRDPFVDQWLDCNDLNPDIIVFTPDFPDIRFEDVSFYVYESFDDFGTIRDDKVVNITKSEEDIPCIDISDELEYENGISMITNSLADSNAKKQEVPSTECQNVTISAEINSSESQKEILAEEHISDEKVIPLNIAQSLETSCNEIKDAESNKNETESIEKISPDQDIDIQDEKNTIDSEFQDLNIFDDIFGKNISERVSQTEYDDKSNIEECKLDDQTKTCCDQKQTDEEGMGSTYEEKELENTVAIEKKNGTEVEDNKQIDAIVPAEELHTSDLGGRKLITETEIVRTETSYVKVSFRRKKYPGLAFLRQNALKNYNKPTLSDIRTPGFREIPEYTEKTKTSKRKIDKECDMPEKRPRKNQKIKQTLKELQSNSNKDVTCSMHEKNEGLALQDKSALKNNAGQMFLQQYKISHPTSQDNINSEIHNLELPNQQTFLSMVSVTENSNKDNNEGKILKEFENVWSTHVPNCKCELSSLEETVDTVVDYTFAYMCKLSQGMKNSILI